MMKLRTSGKKILMGILCGCMVLSGLAAGAAPVYADEYKGYIVFGEDLSKDQKNKVLKFFDVEDVSDYNVSYCSNKEEHEAFDEYLDAKVIGTRALSSIMLVPADKGLGIAVELDNINYCTTDMYLNALISAGVKDVTVHVAAPFEVSGTCALLSAMNAYELMTGEELDDEAVDTAVDELVTTGEVGDAIGDNEQAAELVAALKQQLAQDEEKKSDSELEDMIKNTAGEMGIKIDDETVKLLLQLLKRLQYIELDVDVLKDQAANLYNKVGGMLKDSNIEIPEVSKEQAMSFLEKLIHWFLQLIGKE